jgi:hypothetical protein
VNGQVTQSPGRDLKLSLELSLSTLIYDGLEFGAFMEVPSDSPCFSLLRGVNPVLHAVFALIPPNVFYLCLCPGEFIFFPSFFLQTAAAPACF